MFDLFPPLFVIISFLISILVVTFAQTFPNNNLDLSPNADSAFASNILPNDILRNDISTNDLFTPSLDETTNQMLGSDLTVSTKISADFLDPDATSIVGSDYWILDESDLLAGNLASGDHCQTEDGSLSPFIGRLRARDSEPEKKTQLCGTTSDKENGDSIPFTAANPTVEERKDICPVERYGDRIYPMCSTGYPDGEHFITGMILGTTQIALVPAYPCKFLHSGALILGTCFHLDMTFAPATRFLRFWHAFYRLKTDGFGFFFRSCWLFIVTRTMVLSGLDLRRKFHGLIRSKKKHF